MRAKEYLAVFILFIFLVIIFFHQIFLGFVPVPFDILAGGYFPWADYKWGYPIGVPVKNPLLSDVISVFYPWKFIAIEALKRGEIPLWNPYYFSGTPLLANWQAAVFYPLNIVFFFFNNFLTGWTILIVLQPLLASFFMYLYLRIIKINIWAAVYSAFVYGFSGYLMIFLEYGYLQAAIWLPLLFYFLEKFTITQRVIYLALIPFVLFTIISAGNFQAFLYSLIISFSYLVWRTIKFKNFHLIFLLAILFYFFGIGMASLQLLPTFELFSLSIRSLDSNIVQQHFGLIPLSNTIRFLAPDFFGNPATWNFSGFLYHETSGYIGVIPLMLVICAILKRKNKFLIFSLLISLLLCLDTFLGKIIYIIHLPFISTSYASRVLLVFTFSGAILSALGFETIKDSKRMLSKIILSSILVLSLVTAIIFVQNGFSKDNIQLRNLILPQIILLGFLAILNLCKIFSMRMCLMIIFLLTVFDLMRFSLKFNSFSQAELAYPTTSLINVIKNNQDFSRFEREETESIPSNTWTMYSLYSPSGYDPLILESYAHFYNIYNNTPVDGGVSRYRELSNFNPQILNLLGVRYFVVAKRDKNSAVDSQGQILPQFTTNQFKKIFEEKSNIVLENKDYFGRAMLFYQYKMEKNYLDALGAMDKTDLRRNVILDQEIKGELKEDLADYVRISKYDLNEVTLAANLKNGGILMLSDVNYPGWNVYVNGEKKQILTADGVFRAVKLEKGNFEVKFKFEPLTFKIGSILSLFFLLVSISVMIIFRKSVFKIKN